MDISISSTTYVAYSHRNLLDLNWLGQLVPSDHPINVIYNRMYSATSITSFAAEMMVQCFPRYLKDVLVYVERFVDTLKRTLEKSRGEKTTEEILDAYLLTHRTRSHLALNDGNPAETHLGENPERFTIPDFQTFTGRTQSLRI
ncbi:hypothetical protein ACTXT7_016133 [Hymenolepis weldensis]